MSKDIENKNLKFECQRCGECCSLYCIPCTDKDIKRILNYLKVPLKKASDYVELVEPEDDMLESYEDVPKILIEDYDSQNIVLVLKSDKNEKYCYFYDKTKKCTIYPVRPLVCRFFPIVYEYEENKEKELINDPNGIKFSLFEEGDYCKGIGKGKNVDFEKFRGITVQTIQEDLDFEDKVKIWNLKIIFNQIKDWDEEYFLKYILNIKD
ncbi:MAG: YkgJ family cysteine cluster protein [Candidatus Helarchaeota archaeon]